jgi:hypothetical protein
LDEMLNSEDMAHILPRLFLHPVLIPLTPGGTRKTAKLTGYTPPYVVVFYANYDAAVNTFTDKWLPFSLFRAQNSCVMAGRIGSASKLGGGGGTGITAGVEEEGGEMIYPGGRRSSRVQFDFTPNTNTNMTTTAGDSPEESEDVTPTFGGFTFPPREKEREKEVGGMGMGMGMGTGTGLGIGGSAMRGQPRRSSLARTKFEDRDVGGITVPSREKGIEVVSEVMVAGVAGWDPEWLISLLRTNLRADA